MSTIFTWGLHRNFLNSTLMNESKRVTINSKQETICIIFRHPSPNPFVPQNIA